MPVQDRELRPSLMVVVSAELMKETHWPGSDPYDLRKVEGEKRSNISRLKKASGKKWRIEVDQSNPNKTIVSTVVTQSGGNTTGKGQINLIAVS